MNKLWEFKDNKLVINDKRIIIHQELQHLREDSFWYDGLIAEMGKFRLYACGEIRIYNKNGELVHDGFKERNGGIEGELSIDNDLQKIGNNYDDKYYWENNNWFEVGWIDENNCMTFDMGVVEDDYLSALKMLVSYYVREIK